MEKDRTPEKYRNDAFKDVKEARSQLAFVKQYREKHSDDVGGIKVIEEIAAWRVKGAHWCMQLARQNGNPRKPRNLG